MLQTIYHIFLDRFAGDISNDHLPEFAGGTLKGVESKLDYIKDLGMTAIWLSPFYESVAYHGYHITNFNVIDSRFGTEDDLHSLIDSAHAKGLKVYADFVPNHLSREHVYFKDAQANKNSKYKDWFFFEHWPDNYLSFLYFDEIPKINLNKPEARKHILDSAYKWAGMGIDGFRVDHAIGPARAYNAEFYNRLKTDFPDIYLFGEVWADGVTHHQFKTIDIKHKWWRRWFGINQANLQLEYQSYFDGILDFHTQSIIQKAFKSEISFEKAKEIITKYHKRFPNGFEPVCFLDNHDMDRFIFQCGNDKEKLKQSITFLSELPCPIAMYYGTESGITQSETIKSGKPHADLLVRTAMNWDTIDRSMYDFVKQCFEYRN